MTHSITLSGVELDYYIYSVRAQTLRTAMFNMAVGGKMYRKGNDLAVVRAVSGVSFSLTDGDRLALVGHNGSGKTTLLKVIAGIYEPTRGHVAIDGKMTSMIAPSLGLDPEATGLENIRNLGLMRFLTKKQIADRVDAIVEFSGLGDFIRLPVRTYSQGMIARLTFAVATEFDADILVLDEWLSAGDASFVSQASDRMQRMTDRAKILVLATHSFDLVNKVCNKVCEMQAGKVAYFGSTEGWNEYRAAQSA
jgi:lipopolysaccharide transport system ATP-binding protein